LNDFQDDRPWNAVIVLILARTFEAVQAKIHRVASTLFDLAHFPGLDFKPVEMK
jgi:hypothetical protein